MQSQLKKPIYRSIARDLRIRIGNKHHPGDMLPSETELATHYDVNRLTIRSALSLLSRDNIIRRYHGRGSVILDRKAVGEFALVIRPMLLNAETHPFYSLLSGLMVRMLQEHKPQWSVKLHVGKHTEHGNDFPATLDLLEPDVLRKLRGVIALNPLREVLPKLQAAKVPVVILDTKGDQHIFYADKSLFDLGLAHLKESGCKTVGMIHNEFSDNNVLSHTRMELFRRAAGICGLAICPEWTEPYITPCVTEQNGYDLMTQFWKNRPHPDGLLVVDDILCRGFLRASVQLGIEFPRDIRLVTNANRGISLHYHNPVTRVEYDPAELARLAVDMMMTMVEGGTPSPASIDLPGVLIKGETT